MYTPAIIEQQDDGSVLYTYQTEEKKEPLFLLAITGNIVSVYGRRINHDPVPVDYTVEADMGIKCARLANINFDRVYITTIEEKVRGRN